MKLALCSPSPLGKTKGKNSQGVRSIPVSKARRTLLTQKVNRRKTGND